MASVTVGIAIDPYGVGVALATKQTRQARIGSKSKTHNILAGIATAVPNPAIASINPPNDHPINKTKIRLSADTLVSNFLIISIDPVRKDKLYVKTAAIITITIGHIANAKPSKIEVNVSDIENPKYVNASTAAIIKAPKAALYPGHFKPHKAITNQIIGNKPKIKLIISIIFPPLDKPIIVIFYKISITFVIFLNFFFILIFFVLKWSCKMEEI